MNDNTFFNSSATKIGFFLLTVSLAVFLIPEFTTIKNGDDLGIFIVNYACFLTFMITLFVAFLTRKDRSWTRLGYRRGLMLMLMGMLSAYSLNREMLVFQKSSEMLIAWLSVLTLIALVFILVGKHKYLNYVYALGAGLSVPLFIYLAVYLLPAYGLSAVISPFFGVSLHTFSPIFMLIFIYLFQKNVLSETRYKYWLYGGIGLPIIYCLFFSLQWVNLSNKMHQTYQYSIMEQTEYPSRVVLSQQLPQTKMCADMIKGEMVYTLFENDGEINFWGLPSNSFNEERKHDPFILMASIWTEPLDLSMKERLDVLNSLFNSRHQTEERLWRGDNLKTKSVISHVKVWPEYRMAYTEKIIEVKNTTHRNSWFNQQEALYSFYLPKGGVVTSLSLWIDGKEMPGILSSKQKADSAYTTIVGRRRDPSLVHWQEGNRVTVRVFPVTPTETRRFKIGITSPLKYSDEDLEYQNMPFDGPESKGASELRIIKAVDNLNPQGFKLSMNAKGNLEYDGNYEEDWSFRVQQKSLSSKSFEYQGNQYSLKPLQSTFRKLDDPNVYLDVNNQWNANEIQTLIGRFPDLSFKVYLDEEIAVTAENLDAIMELSEKFNFSLFPFHKIRPENSLVVTKSVERTPILKDLRDNKVFDRMKRLDDLSPYAVFSLGNSITTPYMRSLWELNQIEVVQGDIERLTEILKNGDFPIPVENDNLLVIDESQVSIARDSSLQNSQGAPDHLFRLFAYNTVMKNCGVKSIEKSYTDSTQVALAELAYVVSPLTSMVVLETQKDYDRFDIKKSKNSIGNASMNNSGAVPEPHEWALIGLLAIGIIILVQRRFLV